MIKQEHLSRKIRKRYQQNVDIVFLAISLVRAIVSQVMRLMDYNYTFYYNNEGYTEIIRHLY